MTYQPETQSTIFTRIRDAIAAVSNITNWSENSPERAITDDGFAASVRELQHGQLAVQLSSRIDYAGKEITEEDLDDLGLDADAVDLDLLNSFMSDDDLDELVARNGVTRDPGAFATGEVEFTTASDTTTIPEGTPVATERDATGDALRFETTEEVTPADGSTTVTANIQAAERGAEYNVGSGTIVRLPSPPPGITSVTNPSATTGGADEESNAELRARAKRALIETSGGGTVGGLRGDLVSSFNGLSSDDVIIDEFHDADPIYVDVIVDGGGTDSEVKAAIDDARSVGVEHNLVRPSSVTIDVTVSVSGSDVDTTAVEDDISEYLGDLGIGEDVVRDQVIATVMTADDGITGIDSLTIEDSGGTVSDDRTIGAREKAVAGTVSASVV